MQGLLAASDSKELLLIHFMAFQGMPQAMGIGLLGLST